MGPIRLPAPPIGRRSSAEVFGGGIYGAIKRVVVIGNGFSGVENQCIDLVRDLGLSGCHSLHVRVSLYHFFKVQSFFPFPVSFNYPKIQNLC